LSHRDSNDLNPGFQEKVLRSYLELGGVDGFVGAGTVKAAAETSLDLFYSVNILKSFWFTGISSTS
jgi:hypothetical protein